MAATKPTPTVCIETTTVSEISRSIRVRSHPVRMPRVEASTGSKETTRNGR